MKLSNPANRNMYFLSKLDVCKLRSAILLRIAMREGHSFDSFCFLIGKSDEGREGHFTFELSW